MLGSFTVYLMINMIDINPISDFLYNIFSNTMLMITVTIIIYSVVFYLLYNDLKEADII